MTISKESIYKRFLIFKTFYAIQRPIIVCEGITDNIYLLHAMRGLSAKFPELVETDISGKLNLRVQFFRYPKKNKTQNTSTGKILGLTGGAGGLKNFVNTYRDAVKQFVELAKIPPVILLVDNDAGANSLMSTIKQITGKPALRDAPFMHVVANLYVMATPRDPKGESKIEDFFLSADRAQVLDGKTFDDSNEYDTPTHYGKMDFATRVVRPNAGVIDFGGFEPLLNNIVGVIAHRAALA